MVIINALIFSRLFYCSGDIPPTKTFVNFNLFRTLHAEYNPRSQNKHLIMSQLRATESLGWLKLQLNTVTMVQKCRINQVPPYLCNLFHDRFSVSGRSTRNKSQLNLPNCRSSTGQRSFAFFCCC